MNRLKISKLKVEVGGVDSVDPGANGEKNRIGRNSVDIDGSQEPPLLPLPIRMLYLFSYHIQHPRMFAINFLIKSCLKISFLLFGQGIYITSIEIDR